jgi:hypothetical protein
MEPDLGSAFDPTRTVAREGTRNSTPGVLSPKFSRRLGPNRSSWATIDSSRAIVPTSPAGDGLGDDPVVTIRPAGGAGLRIGFATSIL